METIVITKSWHKVNANYAMTYEQMQYIDRLRNSENCPDWPFHSGTNAMRSITKEDASTIIDALKNGNVVVFE